MRPGGPLLVALAALLTAAGCVANRRWLTNENQAVRVTSGDRLYLTLAENEATDGRWSATCADRTVEVKLEHIAAPADNDSASGLSGKAKVEIRVHRGFDAPAEVRLSQTRNNEKPASAGFSIMLYRETGDRAFWK